MRYFCPLNAWSMKRYFSQTQWLKCKKQVICRFISSLPSSPLSQRCRELTDLLAHRPGGLDHGEVACIWYHLHLRIRHARSDRFHPGCRHARLQGYAFEFVIEVGRLQHQGGNPDLLQRVARPGKIQRTRSTNSSPRNPGSTFFARAMMRSRKAGSLPSTNMSLKRFSVNGSIPARTFSLVWLTPVSGSPLMMLPSTKTSPTTSVRESKQASMITRHPMLWPIMIFATGPCKLLHLIDGSCHAGDGDIRRRSRGAMAGQVEGDTAELRRQRLHLSVPVLQCTGKPVHEDQARTLCAGDPEVDVASGRLPVYRIKCPARDKRTSNACNACKNEASSRQVGIFICDRHRHPPN